MVSACRQLPHTTFEIPRINPNESMLQEINGFLKAVGDAELAIPDGKPERTEIELLTQVREEHIRRLRQKAPKYRLLPKKVIPDPFLKALQSREAELMSKA